MSNKYDAHNLRAQILEYLRPHFPTTLEGWRAKKRKFGERNPFTRKGAIIALANVAEHTAPYFLPAVFLQLNRFYETRAGQPWYTGKIKGVPVKLSDSLMTAFWLGRKKLGEVAEAVVYPRLFKCLPDDSDAVRRAWERCERGRTAAIGTLVRAQGCVVNPFNFSKDKPAWNPRLLCVTCLENFERDYRMGTRQVWQQLPEIFGLPNWGVLLEQGKD